MVFLVNLIKIFKAVLVVAHSPAYTNTNMFHLKPDLLNSGFSVLNNFQDSIWKHLDSIPEILFRVPVRIHVFHILIKLCFHLVDLPSRSIWDDTWAGIAKH